MNVYLDGDFAFGIAQIVGAWLQVGEELDEEKAHQLIRADAFETAMQKALNYLSYCPRSLKDVHDSLVAKEYDEEIIIQVLERLQQGGYVEDRNFARIWVENRNTFRPRSRRMLAVELKHKGVAEEIINETLAEQTDDEKAAYDAASRYARRLMGLDWLMFRDRLGAFLIRRGFSYGTSASVVRMVWDECHSDGDSTEL